MTQKNINVMDILVDKMAGGMKLSKALEEVYETRRVGIPYSEDYENVLIIDLGLSRRASNALLRAKMRRVSDIVEFCQTNKITDITNLGTNSGTEIFEAILNYYWDHASQNERTSFLIDVVERNSEHVRAEIA